MEAVQQGRYFRFESPNLDQAVCEAARLGSSWQFPWRNLVAIDPDQFSAEAIGDWHYWVAQGYCF